MKTRIASRDEIRGFVEAVYQSRLKLPYNQQSPIFWGALQAMWIHSERKESLVNSMFHNLLQKGSFNFALNAINGLNLEVLRVDNKYVVKMTGDTDTSYEKEIEIIVEAVEDYNLTLPE